MDQILTFEAPTAREEVRCPINRSENEDKTQRKLEEIWEKSTWAVEAARSSFTVSRAPATIYNDYFRIISSKNCFKFFMCSDKIEKKSPCQQCCYRCSVICSLFLSESYFSQFSWEFSLNFLRNFLWIFGKSRFKTAAKFVENSLW